MVNVRRFTVASVNYLGFAMERNGYLRRRKKAKCFGSAFESKIIIIGAEDNEYSEILYVYPIFVRGLQHVQAIIKELARLDEDSSPWF